MATGIYLIINTLNKDLYVGSAINIKNRLELHKYFLNKNKHGNKFLQTAWNEFGKDNFIFILIFLIFYLRLH
jgi:group I intron endonuclease